MARTLNLKEAAELLNMSPRTLQAKAHAGEIPGAKPGKKWVFIDEDLHAYIRSKYKANSWHSSNDQDQSFGGLDSRSAAEKLKDRLAQRTKRKPVKSDGPVVNDIINGAQRRNRRNKKTI